MNRRIAPLLRRALMILGALIAMVLQQTFFSRIRILGVVPELVPVAVALAAMWEDTAVGGLMGLIVGVIYGLGGALFPAVRVVTTTLSGILAGVLCQSSLRRCLPTALALALAAVLLCCAGDALMLGWSESGFPADFAAVTVVSALFALPLYPVFRALSRIGGSK